MKELDTYIVSYFGGNIEDLFEWLFENFGNSWGYLGERTVSAWTFSNDFIFFNKNQSEYFYDYLKMKYGWFAMNYTPNRVMISDKNMDNHKEIYEWLLANYGEQRIKWDFEMSVTLQRLFVYFENVTEAIYFKMRWEEGT